MTGNKRTVTGALLLLLTTVPGGSVAEQKPPRLEDWDCGKCDGSGSGSNAIVNAEGMCLDAHERDMNKDGGRVQVWACTDHAAQRWQWGRNGSIVNRGGKCLEVDAPAMRNNGGRVQVWRCNDEPQQQWRMKGRAIVNGGGMCLDVHAPDIANNGGRVQVWTCVDKARSQQWGFLPRN
jgi:hypothetical protein